jgi:hypothetical protein
MVVHSQDSAQWSRLLLTATMGVGFLWELQIITDRNLCHHKLENPKDDQTLYVEDKDLNPLSRFHAAFSERGAKTFVIFSAACFRTKLLPRRSENAAGKRDSGFRPLLLNSKTWQTQLLQCGPIKTKVLGTRCNDDNNNNNYIYYLLYLDMQVVQLLQRPARSKLGLYIVWSPWRKPHRWYMCSVH